MFYDSQKEISSSAYTHNEVFLPVYFHRVFSLCIISKHFTYSSLVGLKGIRLFTLKCRKASFISLERTRYQKSIFSEYAVEARFPQEPEQSAVEWHTVTEERTSVLENST